MFDWVSNSLESIVSFFAKPLVKVLAALSPILATVMGAISDPTGFANWLLFQLCKMIIAVLPQTPESLKISSLILAASDQFPIIGYGILIEIYQSVVFVVGALLIVKIWKMLPLT